MQTQVWPIAYYKKLVQSATDSMIRVDYVPSAENSVVASQLQSSFMRNIIITKIY